MLRPAGCRYCLVDTCILLHLSQRNSVFHPESFTKLIHYAAGETLFAEGAPVYGFYVVCQGRVRLVKRGPRGRKLLLEILSAGDVLGVSGAQTYSACAEAMEACDVGFIDRGDFVQLLKKHPDLAAELVERLTVEVTRLQERIFALVQGGAQAKLALLLLQMSRDHGTPLPDGAGMLIDVPLTRTVLAEMAGLSRETTSLKLSELAAKGIIGSRGRKIIIHDAEALRALL